jgi:hypothetical protein
VIDWLWSVVIFLVVIVHFDPAKESLAEYLNYRGEYKANIRLHQWTKAEKRFLTIEAGP